MNANNQNVNSTTDNDLPATGGASVPASRERDAANIPKEAQPTRDWVPNTRQAPMRRLKQMWCTRFTEEEKEYWHEQLGSGVMPLGVARNILRKRYGIFFRTTLQVSRFQDWIKEDRTMELKNERMLANERRLEKAFPNATKDEIREKLLLLTYAEVYSEADFQLFIKTARADVQIDTLNLNREKFKESLRAKINAGIDMLEEAAKSNPVIRAAVEHLRVAIAPE